MTRPRSASNAREGGRMPAKATSKAQFGFMKAIAAGTAKKKPKGLSRAEAKEYVAGQSPKGLPARATPRKLTGKAKRGGFA